VADQATEAPPAYGRVPPPQAGAAVIRLALYTAALVFFADMARRAVIVRADSLVLPILALCALLLWLIVRTVRREHRRLTRRRTDFIRPRSFPEQRKRDIR